MSTLDILFSWKKGKRERERSVGGERIKTELHNLSKSFCLDLAYITANFIGQKKSVIVKPHTIWVGKQGTLIERTVNNFQ